MPRILKAQSDDFNRKAIEQKKCDILYSLEMGNKKDSLKNIDSGLNDILAALARKHSVSIGINLEEIKKLGKREKAMRLAKIINNIKICRKERTKLAIIGDGKESFFTLLSLGASTEQAKQATSKSF